MHNNYLFVTSFRVKGQMNDSQQIFVQPKGGCTQASDCVCDRKSPKFKRPASTISAAKSSNYAHCARALAVAICCDCCDSNDDA